MGNQQSFYDLPDSKEETNQARVRTVKEVLQNYIEKIFPSKAYLLGDELNCIRDELEEHTEYLVYDTATEIVTRGEKADAIYIILEGDADILVADDNEEEELAICCQHDIIGDASIFFDRPCYHSVVVHKGCCVLRTEEHAVTTSNLAKLVKNEYQMEEYLIARKVLAVPEMEDINAKAINATIVGLLLKQTTLFRLWTDELLKALVNQMEEPWVEVYPTDSTVAGFGDKPRAILMLLRGDVLVRDKFGVDVVPLPLIVRRYPFCFGEEGLFDEEWHFPYTITAKCTCQFLRVQLEDIETISHRFLEQYPERDTFAYWEHACELWQSIKRSREDVIHQKYLPRLQVEFVYRSLRVSNVLPINIYSTRCIYHIAMSGQSMELQLGQAVNCDDDMGLLVMVIDGRYGFGPVKLRKHFSSSSSTSLKAVSWIPRQVVDCRENPADLSNMVALEVPCVIVRLLASDINEIKRQYGSMRRSSFV